jgi:hypothetical protein
VNAGRHVHRLDLDFAEVLLLPSCEGSERDADEQREKGILHQNAPFGLGAQLRLRLQ